VRDHCRECDEGKQHGQLSLYAAIGIAAVTMAGKRLLLLVPTIRKAQILNRDAFRKKMEKPNYAANQKWNRKWGLFYWAVAFVLILPFCLTLDVQAVWRVLPDIVVILMVYDFVYYLAHRFLFHDEGFFGGPLLWVHAWHHRQRNPCRVDSSYIHPLEVAIGIGPLRRDDSGSCRSSWAVSMSRRSSSPGSRSPRSTSTTMTCGLPTASPSNTSRRCR